LRGFLHLAALLGWATFMEPSGLSAQENLVPNPSFEIYSDCEYDQVVTLLDSIVPDWKARVTTPRYFNGACDALPVEAKEGKAYIGLFMTASSSDSSGSQRRDYAQVKLKEQLTPHNPYCLIFRYSVRSEIPKSAAASLRRPLCFLSAFWINPFSFASRDRFSSTSSVCA